MVSLNRTRSKAQNPKPHKIMGYLTFNYLGSHTASFAQIENIQIVSNDIRIKFSFFDETVMLRNLFQSRSKHKEECINLMEHFHLKQIERNVFHESVVPAMIDYLTK